MEETKKAVNLSADSLRIGIVLLKTDFYFSEAKAAS
jgi:hypothetical protein